MTAPVPTPSRPPNVGAFVRQLVTTLILITVASVLLTLLYVQVPETTPSTGHSVIVLVWSGMRPDMVTSAAAPNLMEIGTQGVIALDHHGVFPSTTLVTAASLATGAYPGSSSTAVISDGSGSAATLTPDASLGAGIFAESPLLQTAKSSTPTATATPSVTTTVSPTATPAKTATPATTPTAAASLAPSPTATPSPSATGVPESNLVDLSNDPSLLAADNALGGSLVTAQSLATSALSNGLAVSYEGAGGTALLPALAPAERGSGKAYVVDEQGTYPASLTDRLVAQGIDLSSTSKGDAVTLDQQFTQSYIRVLLPDLAGTNKPFLSVITYGAIKAAGEQSGLGSSAQLAAIQSDDADLGEIIDALRQDNQLNQTNIIITSDHGMSSVIEPGNTSASGQRETAPNDALRTDIASMMIAAGTQGVLPDVAAGAVSTGTITPETTVVVDANGGDDAIYFPATPALLAVGSGNVSIARSILASEIAGWLQTLPQVGVIFVANDLNPPAGTLKMSAASLASPRAPAIIFSFTSSALDVGNRTFNLLSFGGSAYADATSIASGGTLSRRDLHTIFYAEGPSFRTATMDPAPTGAADLAPTIDHILGISAPAHLVGREMSEILSDGSGDVPNVTSAVISSTVATLTGGGELVAVLSVEDVGSTMYLEGGAVARSSQSTDASTLISQALKLANQE